MLAFQKDFRHAARALLRNKIFAVAATVTLALGIGCATAIFSAFNATVLHPLPYPQARNLVTIKANADLMGQAWLGMSLPDALALRDRSNAFAGLGYYGNRQPMNLTGARLYAHIDALLVSPEIFSVLGIRPIMGRWLSDDEARPGLDEVTVISHSLWVQDFGADPDVIGKTIRLNNKPYRVVGVMPPQFAFPDPFVQAWLPETVTPEAVTDRSLYGTPVIARIRRGVSLSQARAELDTLARRLAGEYPSTDKGLKMKLTSLEDEVAAPVSNMFWVLLGAVGLVLLITCANVGNLFLAHNVSRERELAIRICLGATRARTASVVIAEALLLALLGGFLGLGIAAWALDGLRALASGSVQRLANVRLDIWVLAFALIASVTTAFLFGLAPALRVVRLDLNACLRGDLSLRPMARAGQQRAGLQSILVVGQVALVVVLLAGAALMQRSLSNLLNVPLGFNPHRLMGMWLAMPEGKPSDAALLAFQRQVLDQVRAIPGVKSAEFGSNIPLIGPVGTWFRTEQPNQGWVKSPLMETNSTGADYFQVVGLSIIKGRPFLPSDSYGQPCVAILNEAGARAVWGDQNPVGRTIDLHVSSPDHEYCQVIGEVSDARFITLDEPPGPEIYFCRLQKPRLTPALMVRTVHDPLALANAILNQIAGIPGGQRVIQIFSIDQLIERSALQPRFRAVLLSVFAGLTLVIAAIGIYGVMAYFVSQRTREIGIRMALGAQRREVVRMVVGHAILLSMIGLAIGLGLSLPLGRGIVGLLYGVRPSDPLILAAVGALLLAVACLASWLPARRAASIDPVETLRQE